MTISSPCISVCQMNPEVNLCDGCFRTLAEIAAWGSLSDPAKLAVLERVDERRLGLDEAADRGDLSLKGNLKLNRS